MSEVTITFADAEQKALDFVSWKTPDGRGESFSLYIDLETGSCFVDSNCPYSINQAKGFAVNLDLNPNAYAPEFEDWFLETGKPLVEEMIKGCTTVPMPDGSLRMVRSKDSYLAQGYLGALLAPYLSRTESLEVFTNNRGDLASADFYFDVGWFMDQDQCPCCEDNLTEYHGFMLAEDYFATVQPTIQYFNLSNFSVHGAIYDASLDVVNEASNNTKLDYLNVYEYIKNLQLLSRDADLQKAQELAISRLSEDDDLTEYLGQACSKEDPECESCS